MCTVLTAVFRARQTFCLGLSAVLVQVDGSSRPESDEQETDHEYDEPRWVYHPVPLQMHIHTLMTCTHTQSVSHHGYGVPCSSTSMTAARSIRFQFYYYYASESR